MPFSNGNVALFSEESAPCLVWHKKVFKLVKTIFLFSYVFNLGYKKQLQVI